MGHYQGPTMNKLFLSLSLFAFISSFAFASGTFECKGKDFVISGSYGSVAGVSVNSVSIFGKNYSKSEFKLSSNFLDRSSLSFTIHDQDYIKQLISVKAIIENETSSNMDTEWIGGGVATITALSTTVHNVATCIGSF